MENNPIVDNRIVSTTCFYSGTSYPSRPIIRSSEPPSTENDTEGLIPYPVQSWLSGLFVYCYYYLLSFLLIWRVVNGQWKQKIAPRAKS
jgi:hypothetical protein